MSVLWLSVMALLAFTLSYVGVMAVRRWSERRGILLDIPNERSSHYTPVPRGGGVWIVLVTIGGFAGLLLVKVVPPLWLPYLLGGLLIAFVGGLDDLYSLPSGLRLGAHLLGATILVVGIGYWRMVELPYFGRIALRGWGLPITLCWVVGLTNAYNFMDGIDGLAGGQAVVAGIGWAVLGGQFLQPGVIEISVLLVASSLGFLMHNWHPARIFMGDVGATFLGFSFAALTLLEGQLDPRLVTVGVMFVWPFVFDTSFTFIRRLLKKENVFAAHRSHLYQRLVTLGLRHNQVTLIYLSGSAIGGTLGLLWWLNVHWAAMGLLVSWIVMAGGLLLSTAWLERKAT